ncbi:hypothetical protein PILCRDRAFT_86138 [Piloderma croceum F 1598]|uniref:Uncharacterized protein n=1 Tax=Piloderma croceum (strain F 1598) TaxID=765440 RepID=A0A0C3FS91_PILCF|nr:hypothetical protein PILCRDRAFT_86138 [Piloderma croceum F 1598]
MPTINYQYPVSEGSMDLTYIFAAASANTTLPQNLLLEGTGPGTMQNRHPSVMSSIHPGSSDQTFKFGVDSRTLTRVDSGVEADPYAAAFIRERLGDNKWNVFSARLFERRLGMTKAGSKNTNKETSAADSRNGGGAGAIDFMVKVEVVKEVLRTYVPHPYNPLKSLKHAYAPSPTGDVTLTRSIILALSGWSNTQFSYWARRVEAVSVLTPHDERLRTLGSVLQQRLKDDIGTEPTSIHSDLSEEGRSETPNSTSASGQSSCFQQEFDYVQGMTGKGLDVIIDEAKKRTGASQFLRGKHSSLDPFGAIYMEDENGAEVSAPVFMPTFQAVEYSHSMPSSNAEQPGKKSGKGKIKQKTPRSVSGRRHEPQATHDVEPSVPHLSSTVSASRGVSAPPMLASQELVPPTFTAPPTNTDVMSLSHTVAVTSVQQNTQTHNRSQQHASKDAEHISRRKLFPVSDSRSELENMPQICKRGGEALESVPKRQTRQSGLIQ